jgi:hypothetical protein
MKRSSRNTSNGDAGDQRAARRDRRKQAERARMEKHGASTGEAYRNAILKRLRKNAGKQPR